MASTASRAPALRDIRVRCVLPLLLVGLPVNLPATGWAWHPRVTAASLLLLSMVVGSTRMRRSSTSARRPRARMARPATMALRLSRARVRLDSRTRRVQRTSTSARRRRVRAEAHALMASTASHAPALRDTLVCCVLPPLFGQLAIQAAPGGAWHRRVMAASLLPLCTVVRSTHPRTREPPGQPANQTATGAAWRRRVMEASLLLFILVKSTHLRTREPPGQPVIQSVPGTAWHRRVMAASSLLL